MQTLDPTAITLSDFNLIEASAGTGKTYTITALYLRLVLEKQIPVKNILVVTYTNAATKELRERIRSRLMDMLRIFLAANAPTDDALAAHLLAFHADRELSIRCLRNALRGFDEASIYTIHGFCKRVLADNAFESGMPFVSELKADTNELLQEIVEDFWRREFYPASSVIVQYLLDTKTSPNSLLQQIKPHLGKPYLRIVTPPGTADGAGLEEAFNYAFAAALNIWREQRPVIEELLLTSAALNRNSYNPISIPQWIEAMQTYLDMQPPRLARFAKFDRFMRSTIESATKKGRQVPEHEFFNACENLAQAGDALADHYRYQIPVKLLDYCEQELTTRKQREQVQSYDDLLLNLHRALSPKSALAKKLSAALQQRYKAALIDEFQDTDPVQYEIFQRIYAASALPVFLVGDPKQAIYSFRGADIFAYLTARRTIQHLHTLEVNWRSAPALLTALNTLFGAVKKQPFLFDGIPFHAARPPARPHPVSLLINGAAPAPLQLWFMPKHSGEPISKTKAKQCAAQATAAEIARLLQLGADGRATIGNRALGGGDLAVLVRTHQEGRLMRSALLRLNVPSVQYADDSVWVSAEAQQLQWLLEAVAEPNHEGRLRALLASALHGVTGEDLYALREDEAAWTQWLEKFQNYQLIWREHGFMRFFRTWLVTENVAQRLLSFHDGERRLTNLLHLAELAHRASRHHPNPANLCKWLSDSRSAPNTQEEQQQLRLESDAHLVRIVTVHKSKGLEYEIVFCPFLWDGNLKIGKDATLLYHDAQHPQQTILAIGADKKHPGWPAARREAMAENLRLFYVAMTRAKQCAYLVWGQMKDAETAAPAWFLHQPPAVGASQDALEVCATRFKTLNAPAFQDELYQHFAAQPAVITMQCLQGVVEEQRYQAPAAPPPLLQARTLQRKLRDMRRIGSFSTLTAELAADDRDYDISSAAPAMPASTALNPFTFPRGARAGSCLHALLQHLDFCNRQRAQLEAQVQRSLRRHSFDAELWTAPLADWVEQILATPLDTDGLTLNTVSVGRRSDEMEFFYPVKRLEAAALRDLLQRHGYSIDPYRTMLERLDFRPLHGYMRGFIDLVFEAQGRFYLVDYKSNWLGESSAAYQQAQLAPAMAHKNYVLQYLIYSVALHRYLRLRVANYSYERHFGAVFYLFLRGMQPALGADYGVFSARPSADLLQALEALLL